MLNSHLRDFRVAEQSHVNAATIYLSSLAPSGRRSMYFQLKLVLRTLGKRREVAKFDWPTLTYADVIRVRAQLIAEGRSPHSINLALAGIRGVVQCAFHLGQVDADQVLRVKAVRRVPIASTPRGRSLQKVEARKLLRHCHKDRTPIGVRDACLITTLLSTGIRRAEAAALNLEDYDHVNGNLRIRRAKGNRDRFCPLPKGANKEMVKWLENRGRGAGSLFCRVSKSGRVTVTHLSTQTIHDIVRRRAADARIGFLTPHDLRRTFVTHLLLSTGDINLARNLVGHCDVKTTSRYDLRKFDGRKYIEKCQLV